MVPIIIVLTNIKLR